tara:strand:- start:1718 stop:1888 length:171 start_codon:yes stop_codon:yes gene_type:complete
MGYHPCVEINHNALSYTKKQKNITICKKKLILFILGWTEAVFLCKITCNIVKKRKL